MNASATAESVPGHFTLRQAVAWIAWRDPEHPILPEVPEDKEPASLSAWLVATAELERRAEIAAVELAAMINAGKVAAIGMLADGWPGSGGAQSAEPATRIPASVHAPCVIPAEWLGVQDGGWLLLKDRIVNGQDTGPRYCRVTVDAAQVRAEWPLKAADHGVAPDSAAAAPPAAGPDARAAGLHKASAAAIGDAVQAVYDEAEQRGAKPPNVCEVVAPVVARLAAAGLTTTQRQVQRIAGEDLFKQRRLGTGKRPGATF
jgi:hypothetical protein